MTQEPLIHLYLIMVQHAILSHKLWHFYWEHNLIHFIDHFFNSPAGEAMLQALLAKDFYFMQ